MIRRPSSDLERRVEERTAELTRSNEELQQFAYVVAHDLKEPLRTVASFAELLADRYRGRLDPDADEFIEHIVVGATRMQALIDDLLRYSQVDTPGATFEPVDLGDVIDEVLEDLRTSIQESGAVISRGSLPSVHADRRQMAQLFQNLLGNAIKFRGARPPEIRVEAARDSGEWVLSVRDNGIGIDPRYADRIFAIFQRLHTQEEFPGTGIGLALCRKVVARHGGRIWVDSEPGRGSTFRFSLGRRLADREASTGASPPTCRPEPPRSRPG